MAIGPTTNQCKTAIVIAAACKGVGQLKKTIVVLGLLVAIIIPGYAQDYKPNLEYLKTYVRELWSQKRLQERGLKEVNEAQASNDLQKIILATIHYDAAIIEALNNAKMKLKSIKLTGLSMGQLAEDLDITERIMIWEQLLKNAQDSYQVADPSHMDKL
jgi:hypothetical protein